LKCVSDFGCLPEPVEDGDTFDENAYKKALHYAKVLGLPAIADDSGLVVEALNGEPGVYSARYAGEKATDEENCLKLLTKMEGITNRKAAFQCVLSIAVPSGPALTYEGSCQGIITETMQGSGGFGYDPLFFYPELGKTFAEMTAKEKTISAIAARPLRNSLPNFPRSASGSIGDLLRKNLQNPITANLKTTIGPSEDGDFSYSTFSSLARRSFTAREHSFSS